MHKTKHLLTENFIMYGGTYGHRTLELLHKKINICSFIFSLLTSTRLNGFYIYHLIHPNPQDSERKMKAKTVYHWIIFSLVIVVD